MCGNLSLAEHFKTFQNREEILEKKSRKSQIHKKKKKTLSIMFLLGDLNWCQSIIQAVNNVSLRKKANQTGISIRHVNLNYNRCFDLQAAYDTP